MGGGIGAADAAEASDAAGNVARFVVDSDGTVTDTELATPEGRQYSLHVQNDHPDRNITGWVIDEAIDQGTVVGQDAQKIAYYDAKNNVSVILSKTADKVVSTHKGPINFK